MNFLVVLKNEFMNILGIWKKKKKRNINDGLAKHNLKTNHNCNFKESKISLYIHKKKARKLLNLV